VAGFPGGRLWIPLGLVATDELVASSVALALGIRPGADDVTAQLAAALAPLGRVLLVLDGCEAVVDGVASLVTTLISYCPLLSVVVTSWVPLGVEGEQVVALGPLPGPAGPGRTAMLASLPLRLLADRVREGGRRLDIDEEIAPFVAELCRRCGGVPLVLELVAAQLAAMSVADLLDHLPEVIEQGQSRLRVIEGCALGIWRYEPASGRSGVAPAGQGVSVIIAVPRRVRSCWGRGRQEGTVLASKAGSGRPEW
jgi:predicted ATPase